MTGTSRTDFDELIDQKERDLNSRPSRQELKTLPHEPPPLTELVVVNNSSGIEYYLFLFLRCSA